MRCNHPNIQSCGKTSVCLLNRGPGSSYMNIGTFVFYQYKEIVGWHPNLWLTHWGRSKMAAVSQTTLFKSVFLNKIVLNSIKISLKFVPNGPINNIPALIQITAWRQPGDKPLSEPMMVKLPTHICVTRPQWVKSLNSLSVTVDNSCKLFSDLCINEVS